MNPLYSSLNQQNNGMLQQLQAFKTNPSQFLLSRNINIPQEYMTNPRDAIQYLLNTGKLSQSNFNQLTQMASQMGVRLH